MTRLRVTWHTMLCSVIIAAGVVMLVPALACGAERPNVVFIMADDLGWADLGCYCSAFYETPHLDNFAREGMQFTDAYSACPVCSPTRAAAMTGKYPARLQLADYIPGYAGVSFTGSGDGLAGVRFCGFGGFHG